MKNRTLISIGLAIALCASACLIAVAPPSGAATAVQPPSATAAAAALSQAQTAAVEANQPQAAVTTAQAPATQSAGADAAATAADGTPPGCGWPSSAATPVNTTCGPSAAEETGYAGTGINGAASNTPTLTPTANGVAATSPAGNIEVDLPKATAAAQTGGADVLASTDTAGLPSTTVVQAPTATGDMTVSQVISNPAQTVSTYKFSLPDGYKLVPQQDGTIAIMSGPASKAPTQATTLGWINAPWAMDANGNAVPTSYSVSGKVLTQTIQPNASTAYPVVADPSISFGWLIYIHFSHADLQWAKFVGAIENAASLAGILCQILNAVPDVGLALGILCGSLMLALGIWVNGLVNNALGQVTTLAAWWCPGTGWFMPPTCGGGAYVVGRNTILQTWDVNVYWTGLQFDLTYVLYALAGWGYEINP
jgi:hypothetical protein